MVYNVRSGMALAHAVHSKVGGAFGKFVGGNAYTKSRAKGGSRKEALQSSSKAKVNQRKIDPAKANKPRNAAQKVLGGATRLATMPAGMIHDIAQGGVIGLGKNFMPRLNNALHGSSVVNHADVMKQPKKDPNARTEAQGGSEAKGKKLPRQTNSVMRRDDSEKKTIGGKPRKGRP